MFDKKELAVIHKALSEVTIKGADAPAMTALITKVVDAHNAFDQNKDDKPK